MALDILVIGVGDPGQQIRKETKEHLKKKGIHIEVLPTEHACTTFNFLNVERRCVAAALIPGKLKKSVIDEAAKQARVKMNRERDLY